jgi:hypothetical protein
MANARACIFFAAMMLGSKADPVNEDMALDSSSSRHLVANKYAYAVPSDWYTHKVSFVVHFVNRATDFYAPRDLCC